MPDITWTPATVALSKLVPWDRNPKTISKAHAKRLLELWDRLGQFQTIAIGPAGEVYDGHQRLSVLKAAHGPRFEVQTLQSSRALTEKEREELTVAAHVGTTGQFDWGELANWDAGELQSWGFDAELLQDWSAGVGALGAMLEAEKDVPPDDPGAQIDRAEELRERWGVEAGQLWRLGEHRLICGDCTDAGVVARVMGGEKAGMVFTSPPYAQQRDYTEDSDTSDWDGLIRETFGAAICADDCQVLVNLGLVHRDGEWWPYWDSWVEWMRQQGWRRFGWYVWDQGPGLPGDWGGRLAPAFEFIFHFNKVAVRPEKWIEKLTDSVVLPHGTGLRGKDGNTSGWTSPAAFLQSTKIPDNVIRVMREKARNIKGHPAMFPVAFPEFALKCWGGLVYDPFLGSGTTLIACERLHRRCRAVEISPAYCAVAIERFYQMTGVVPELIQDA